MIFQNIDFHNVAEIEKTEDESAYRLLRVPNDVRVHLNEVAQGEPSTFSACSELRFKLLGDSASITLRLEEGVEPQTAFIYYGDFQGDWQHSSRAILSKDTTLTFERPINTDKLKALQNEFELPFNCELIRLVLPQTTCYFVDVKGEIAPPDASDVPKATYLAYGSSITHGSLGLTPVHAYPFQIARALKCDCLNLGFPGSAFVEPKLAEYLVSRKDWDFATLELGVNVVGCMETDEFDRRVKAFTALFANDTRPVFCTDIFPYFDGDPARMPKAQAFREIVRKYAEGRLIYTPANALMPSTRYLTADLVHPDAWGLEEIAQNWSQIIAEHLKKER